MASIKCDTCNTVFDNDITLNNGIKYNVGDQFEMHRMYETCANFETKSVNYVICTPFAEKDIYRPIADLPEDIGNVMMVYTGKSEHGGILSALGQLLKFNYCYNLKFVKKYNTTCMRFDDVLMADTYKRSMMREMNKHLNGLLLVKVRESDDIKEILTSEYCMIEKFHRIAETIFYSQPSGSNALCYNKEKLDEMLNEDCRCIEYKLKKGLYLRFTHEDIEELKSKFTNSEYDHIVQNGLTYNNFNAISDLKAIYDFFYKISPNFFTITPAKSAYVNVKSFFELGTDPDIEQRMKAREVTESLKQQ